MPIRGEGPSLLGRPSNQRRGRAGPRGEGFCREKDAWGRKWWAQQAPRGGTPRPAVVQGFSYLEPFWRRREPCAQPPTKLEFWGSGLLVPDCVPRVQFCSDLPGSAEAPRMGVSRCGPLGWGRKLRAPGRGPLQLVTRLCGDHLQASPAKKARAGPEEDSSTPPSSPLSPEQLIRIQRNKAAALLRLAARNVPVGFGESWKKHLSVEFRKPYFIKVSVKTWRSLSCLCSRPHPLYRKLVS